MSKSLPLVKLSVLRPLVSALRDRGLDPEPVLTGVGLTEEAILSEDTSVHVMVIHHFLENAAEAVGDRTFAASVGRQLEPAGWPMIADAIKTAQSLGDFLNIYVSRANQVASSVSAYLDVRGDIAVFGETRLFEPTITPAQNDGFMIALALSILRYGVGNRIDMSRVTLVVCDPAALPDDFENCTILRGDTMGFRITFPSDWLPFPIGVAPPGQTATAIQTDTKSADFLSDFRRLLGQETGNRPLDVNAAAELVQMSRTQLGRRLARLGTDISSEIAAVQLAYAKDQLGSTSRSIGDIALALGYSDPANFARAFRRSTGQSPSAFREAFTSPSSAAKP